VFSADVTRCNVRLRSPAFASPPRGSGLTTLSHHTRFIISPEIACGNLCTIRLSLPLSRLSDIRIARRSPLSFPLCPGFYRS
jgi:hypothetical protein